MHINWHTQVRNWHVVWLVKKKTTRQSTRYKLKWHVLLGMWHWGDILKRKYRCQLTFIFVFENVTWHFGFEVECSIKNLSNIHIDHCDHTKSEKIFTQSPIASASHVLWIYGIAQVIYIYSIPYLNCKRTSHVQIFRAKKVNTMYVC